MKVIKIKVWRQNPEVDILATLQEYEVAKEDGDTVLQGLLQIYEEMDSTLAFRFGCRNKYCGLCGVEVDGRPRLACLTKLRDGMVVKPLKNLPVIRDLVVDRAWLLPLMDRLEMYVPDREMKDLEVIHDPPDHIRLWDCVECLCCLSTCPCYRHGDTFFGGPYTFLKLTQLHLDPRNSIDRAEQARALGVERCVTCQKCYCVIGLPLYEKGIAPLLNKALGKVPSAL